MTELSKNVLVSVIAIGFCVCLVFGLSYLGSRSAKRHITEQTNIAKTNSVVFEEGTVKVYKFRDEQGQHYIAIDISSHGGVAIK